MVPLLFAFLLFGQSSAKISDFDQLVDRVINNVENIANFFGYNHLEILEIDNSYYKKFLFLDVKAGLVCERGALDIVSLKRLGPAEANITDGSISYTMSLEVPQMNAELGPCTFRIWDHFSVDGPYKAVINDTTIEVMLEVIQEGKKCRLQVTNLKMDVGGVFVYSGASFIHLLEDWTFEAVSYLVKDKVIEKANEAIQKIIKQYPQDLVSFPCPKNIKG